MPSSTPSPEYSSLRNKESEEDSVDGLDMLPLHTPRTARRRKCMAFAKLFSVLVLIAFIVLTFALSFHAVDLLGKIGEIVNHPKPATQQRSFKYPCGETAAQAQAKGCIFDVMTMAWQSPECFDPDLHEEFMMQGPWEFWADPQGMVPLSYDEVSQKGQISWTTRKYFVTHCIFGFKALHRAWQRGWRLDSNGASSEHTEVCARILANTSVPLEALTTRIHVDFPSCN